MKAPHKAALELMRQIVALVEVDGREREITFWSNNLDWSPLTVADLYRRRWQIEVFFKQIKRTLQLADFVENRRKIARLCPLWEGCDFGRLLCKVDSSELT